MLLFQLCLSLGAVLTVAAGAFCKGNLHCCEMSDEKKKTKSAENSLFVCPVAGLNSCCVLLIHAMAGGIITGLFEATSK